MTAEHVKTMMKFIRDVGPYVLYQDIESKKNPVTRCRMRRCFEEAFKLLKCGDYRFKNVDWPTSQS